MTESEPQSLEDILRHCEASAPNPWYPSEHARATGTPRDRMDPLLNELRVAGLVQLTDWVADRGQGYVLTPAGSQALQSARSLNKLRTGQIPDVGFHRPQLQTMEHSPGTPWARGEYVREAFLGSRTPVVTYALLLLNIGVFVAGIGLAAANHVGIDDYLNGRDMTGAVLAVQRKMGFLTGEDVYLRGQWWRLITACFNHIGWIHLAVNMYSLFAVGPLLERLWGSGRFLILYLLAGLGGSCGMLIENPFGGGAGASGAIWGVLASLATWIYLNRAALPKQLISSWRGQLVSVFILNMFITFGVSGISKGGHFGGGLVGLIAAVPLDYVVLGTAGQRKLAIVALLAIPVLCVGLVVRSFTYTGPVMDLADAADNAMNAINRHAKPLFEYRGPWDRQAGENVARLLEEAEKRLEQAAGNPPPRPPFWLPSADDRWAALADDAERFQKRLASDRREILRRNQSAAR